MSRSTTALITALDVLREKLGTNDIPVQQVLAFAHVADKGEVAMSDFIDLLGLSQAAVSRTLYRLASGRPDDPGFGLLVAEEDPYYRKRKLVRLTPRGKAVAAELERAVANLHTRQG